MSVSRLDPAELGALPAVAPFVVRPGCVPGRLPAAGTGLPSLDALLGGGFPRGRISEVVGPRGSGRTSVLLGSLARATGSGALAALVDVTDRLDPASARAAGLELGQLLWVRCGGDLRTAIQAADVIVRGGGFDLVAVDLGELPPWRLQRVPAAVFVRLQRAVEGTPTTLVLAGTRRVAGSMATAAVTLSRPRLRWQRGGPGLMAGLATEVRLVRSRERAPGASVALVWTA
jgi:recA bacterial DNA recombination protein